MPRREDISQHTDSLLPLHSMAKERWTQRKDQEWKDIRNSCNNNKSCGRIGGEKMCVLSDRGDAAHSSMEGQMTDRPSGKYFVHANMYKEEATNSIDDWTEKQLQSNPNGWRQPLNSQKEVYMKKNLWCLTNIRKCLCVWER